MRQAASTLAGRALRHAYDGPFFRRLAIGGVRHIPLPLKFATMPLWAGIFHALVPEARRAAEHNLERVLGPLPAIERHRASLRLFTNYAQSIANNFALYYDLPLGIEVTTHAGDMLERMHRDKRGAVLVTGHMGYWQIAPYLMQKKAYAPLTMAMAEEPNAQTAELEDRLRRHVRIVYTTRSPLALVELARRIGQGELVGMQMDRALGAAHVLVDFFGEPAPFPTGPATLARATGAPMIPVFILAKDDRRHCEFFVEEPIFVSRTRDREADVAEATHRLAAIYEKYVRRFPDQWFNFFDFWHPPTMAPDMSRIVVTGLGAVSGFGRGVGVLWRSLLEGARATSRRPELGPLAGVGPIALALPWGDTATRAETIVAWAAEEALADAGVQDRSQLALAFGTTKGGIGPFLELVRDAEHARWGPPARATYAGTAFTLARHLELRGPVEVTSAACVSSNVALGTALDLLRRGEAVRVLAGGGDALSDFVVSGFHALKALDPAPSRPFDGGRRGLNLGEGAAFLVLEETARARGAQVRAYLDGFGLAGDGVHMTGPDRQGRGATRAIAMALAEAGLAPGDVSFVSAHGTGTIFNDLMEDKALALAQIRAPLHSIKGAIGHTLGAAAALEAVVTVRALETGLVPPTVGHEARDPEISLDVVFGAPRVIELRAAVSTSSGFGGTNAAIVLRRA